MGLNAVTKLSPPRYVGQMMGRGSSRRPWGGILAGLIADEFRANVIETMPGLYTQVALTSVGIGLVLIGVSIVFKKARIGD